MHDVDPAKAEMKPRGQGVQLDAPVLDIVPGGQSLQPVAVSFSANLPAAHEVQIVDAVSSAYVPELHEGHEAWPRAPCDFPTSQSSQTVVSP